MLLELAIGDAYGVGFEFVSDEIIQEEHKLNKYYNSRIDDLKAGQYSDDTQMSLAIAELMLSKKEWTNENIVYYFLKAFQRDPRHGYAKNFYKFLEETKSVDDFLKNIHPDSVRNGAAMRSVPIGLYSDINELLYKAEIQASITHNTQEGIMSSKAVALMSHYFFYNIGKKEDLKSFIESKLLEPFMDNKTTRTDCDAVDTIDAVLTVLKKSNSLMEILDNSISLGGDTDSVASIACGVASFSNEYKQDFKDFLYEDLENKDYGKDYIEKLNEKLLNIFK